MENPQENTPAEVGGRFVSTVSNRGTGWGDVVYDISVRDTLTGDEMQRTVYDPTQVRSAEEDLAKTIVARHDSSLKADGVRRFDIPGADRDDDDVTGSETAEDAD